VFIPELQISFKQCIHNHRMTLPWLLDNFDRIVVSAMIGVALTVFGTTLVRAVYLSPAWISSSPAMSHGAAATTSWPGMIPLRLIIPALEVEARVQRVGITGRGNIGIPTNYTDVAWYQGGPVPGVPGMAIFDGHADNGLGMDGVFKRLGSLQAGQEVLVRNRDGSTLRFVIYDVQSYPYQSVPMHDILAPRDTAELALISCEGTWLKQLRTYDRRVVVYARLIDQ
jgi:sortase (surface protein transpeptidase)